MALGEESWQVVARVEARGCSRDFGPLEEVLVGGGTAERSSSNDGTTVSEGAEAEERGGSEGLQMSYGFGRDKGDDECGRTWTSGGRWRQSADNVGARWQTVAEPSRRRRTHEHTLVGTCGHGTQALLI
jgi:hypothetical protein